MSIIPEPRSSLDDDIRNAIAFHSPGDLSEYVVGHFELIVELHNPRSIEDGPTRVRFSPEGSSTHLSLGLLHAATRRLEHQMDAAEGWA